MTAIQGIEVERERRVCSRPFLAADHRLTDDGSLQRGDELIFTLASRGIVRSVRAARLSSIDRTDHEFVEASVSTCARLARA